MKPAETKTVGDVRRFWEKNPLFHGESNYTLGTKEFFEDHRRAVLEANLPECLPDWLFPAEKAKAKVLDLGCGPGFWVIEFGLKGYHDLTGADLTFNALKLSQARCQVYGISNVKFVQQNAEKLGFADGVFSHVNCQGVIHHTPETEACLHEIWRCLQPGGTAIISVYYRNIFLRAWPILKGLGKILRKSGAAMPGRGREEIYTLADLDEIVRTYDGAENPIGKCYTRKQFFDLLGRYFEIQNWKLLYFPVRALPFRVPRIIQRLLSQVSGFMIIAQVRKKERA